MTLQYLDTREREAIRSSSYGFVIIRIHRLIPLEVWMVALPPPSPSIRHGCGLPNWIVLRNMVRNWLWNRLVIRWVCQNGGAMIFQLKSVNNAHFWLVFFYPYVINLGCLMNSIPCPCPWIFNTYSFIPCFITNCPINDIQPLPWLHLWMVNYTGQHAMESINWTIDGM